MQSKHSVQNFKKKRSSKAVILTLADVSTPAASLNVDRVSEDGRRVKCRKLQIPAYPDISLRSSTSNDFSSLLDNSGSQWDASGSGHDLHEDNDSDDDEDKLDGGSQALCILSAFCYIHKKLYGYLP